MARSTVTLTTAWQLLSSVKATFTVQKTTNSSIFFNETATDTNMIGKVFNQGDQVVQGENKATYCKASPLAVGTKIVVVEAGV